MAVKKKNKKESLDDALLKVALGCQVAEITREYSEVDGKLKLVKRKEIRKDIPPDLKAMQILMEQGETGDISTMTDEELEQAKQKLIQQILKNGEEKK